MTADRSAALPPNPFPGIEPFGLEHRDVFFARQGESEALLRRLVMYRGTLLYGEQGVGKSSILNAGLIPRALEEGYEPSHVRVQPVLDQEFILETTTGGPTTIPARDLSAFTETFLGPGRLLLVLDQFEEWITLFDDPRGQANGREVALAQRRIGEAVARLIRNERLPVKILLAFREDYLAKMSPLFEQVPSLPDQFVRLLPVPKDSLVNVIRGPFEQHPGHYVPAFSKALAAGIVSDLAEHSSQRTAQTAEVQIVCHDLFARVGVDEDPGTIYRDSGAADGILSRYFSRALDTIEPNVRDAAVVLLSRMVSPAGTRNVVSRDDLVRRVELEEGIDPELLVRTLDSLDRDANLVKLQRREDVDYFEISSEFLIDWITDQDAQRLVRLETSALEDELDQERIRGAKRSSKIRNLTVALLLALVATVTLAVLLASQLSPPLPMAGDLNVAVAEFSGDGDLGEEARLAGEGLSDELKSSLSQLGNFVVAEVRSPRDTGPVSGDTREERATAAEELAAQINADLVVFGEINEASGVVELTLEYYLADRNLGAARDAAGYYTGEVTQITGDAVSLETLLAADGATAFADLLVGSSLSSVGLYEDALDYLGTAESLWPDTPGKEVVYRLLGEASLELGDSDMARQYHRAALSINPEYSPSHLGIASVEFQQSRGARCGGGAGTTDLVGLEAAQIGFEQVVVLEGNSEIGARASLELGRLHSCFVLLGEDRLQDAQRAFRTVIDATEDADHRLRSLAADAYSGLAFTHVLAPDIEAALAAYQAAIDLSSDRDEMAFFHTVRGDLFACNLANTEAAEQEYRAAAELTSQPLARADC